MVNTSCMFGLLGDLNTENQEVRELASKAVKDYRRNRDPYEWERYMEVLTERGVSQQKLAKYRFADGQN